MQKLLLAGLALCSLINSLQAELIYAAVSGLPAHFLPLRPSSGNVLQELRPPPMQDAKLIRPQRSLYGPAFSGWQGPPVQPPSIGLGHISKQELITLLEAAQEVAKSASEPEPEPSPEPRPGPGAAPAPGSAGGAPAGVPLTVSLPAFVPIQLSAMYTAPAPAAAAGSQGVAAAPGAPEGGAEQEAEEEEPEDEEEEEDEEVEEEEEEEEEAEPEPAPAPIKPYYPIYHPWSSRPPFRRPVAPYAGRTTQVSSKTKSKSGSKLKARKSKAKKSKARSKKRAGRKPLSSSKPTLRYAGSAQNFHALPPPPFLSRPPGHLKLVPSNQLLSNWNDA